MTSEHDETSVTVTGVAPAVIRALQQAVTIARDHGRAWVGVEDLWAALAGEGIAPLWWPRQGHPPIQRGDVISGAQMEADSEPLSYNEFRRIITEWVPGPSRSDTTVGPQQPASITYEVSGPHAAEFTRYLESPPTPPG